MSKHEKIIGNIIASTLIFLIFYAAVSGIFNMLFRDNLNFIGHQGARGNAYIDSSY